MLARLVCRFMGLILIGALGSAAYASGSAARGEVNSVPQKSGVFVVSGDKWSENLVGRTRVVSTDWLLEKALGYSRESTRLLRKGRRQEGLFMAVTSSILHEYVIDVIGFVDNSRYQKMRATYNANRAAILQAGVSSKDLSESLYNLKVTLPRNEVEVIKPTSTKDVAVTKASSVEKKKLALAVKDRLIDPDSARFYDFLVIGNQTACVIVNSKNRMGGYAGRTAIFLIKNQSGWAYTHDARTLEGCLRLAQIKTSS